MSPQKRGPAREETPYRREKVEKAGTIAAQGHLVTVGKGGTLSPGTLHGSAKLAV